MCKTIFAHLRKFSLEAAYSFLIQLGLYVVLVVLELCKSTDQYAREVGGRNEDEGICKGLAMLLLDMWQLRPTATSTTNL